MGAPKGTRPPAAGMGRILGSKNKNSDIKEIAQDYSPGAMMVLIELAGLVPGKPPAKKEETRLAAAKEICDRGYGRPAQAHSVTGADGGPVMVITGVIRADEAEQIEHSPSPPTIEAEPMPPTSVEPTPSPSPVPYAPLQAAVPGPQQPPLRASPTPASPPQLPHEPPQPRIRSLGRNSLLAPWN
jgi:hypothetical protein